MSARKLNILINSALFALCLGSANTSEEINDLEKPQENQSSATIEREKGEREKGDNSNSGLQESSNFNDIFAQFQSNFVSKEKQITHEEAFLEALTNLSKELDKKLGQIKFGIEVMQNRRQPTLFLFRDKIEKCKTTQKTLYQDFQKNQANKIDSNDQSTQESNSVSKTLQVYDEQIEQEKKINIDAIVDDFMENLINGGQEDLNELNANDREKEIKDRIKNRNNKYRIKWKTEEEEKGTDSPLSYAKGRERKIKLDMLNVEFSIDAEQRAKQIEFQKQSCWKEHTDIIKDLNATRKKEEKNSLQKEKTYFHELTAIEDKMEANKKVIQGLNNQMRQILDQISKDSEKIMTSLKNLRTIEGAIEKNNKWNFDTSIENNLPWQKNFLEPIKQKDDSSVTLEDIYKKSKEKIENSKTDKSLIKFYIFVHDIVLKHLVDLREYKLPFIDYYDAKPGDIGKQGPDQQLNEFKEIIFELYMQSLEKLSWAKFFIEIQKLSNFSENNIKGFKEISLPTWVALVEDKLKEEKKEKQYWSDPNQSKREAKHEVKIQNAIKKLPKDEAEKKKKEIADNKAKEEEQRKAKEEAERIKKEEADRKAKEEAERQKSLSTQNHVDHSQSSTALNKSPEEIKKEAEENKKEAEENKILEESREENRKLNEAAEKKKYNYTDTLDLSYWENAKKFSTITLKNAWLLYYKIEGYNEQLKNFQAFFDEVLKLPDSEKEKYKTLLSEKE